MRVLIIGAGRMGVRHAQGVKTLNEIASVILADINRGALQNAQQQLSDSRFEYCLIDDLQKDPKGTFDVCIIAATAGDRIGLLKLVCQLQSKYILIEKPLGQSMQQVNALNEYINDNKLDCAVNLNMRLYDSFIQLKKDLQTIPQLQGEKTIAINTGTLGIGANGIHYLDLLFFLLDADEAILAAADIDDTVISSGRGPQFADFGGWAVIRFYKATSYVGKAMLSMSSSSTVFGSWEVVAPHGRIYFNEVEGRRIDTLRKANSSMPVNRYHADYQAPNETKIESPFLGDITAKWIRGLMSGSNLLPHVNQSMKVHKLLFDWLEHGKMYKNTYPIT